MAISLQKARGTTALVGSFVDDLARNALKSDILAPYSIQSAPLPYHITFLSKEESRSITQEQLDSLDVDTRHIFSTGIGGRPDLGVFWIIIIWAAGQQLRKKLGLPAKHFHITLSATDNHDVSKGIASLLPGQLSQKPDEEFLDHLVFSCRALGEHHAAQEHSIHLIVGYPESHKGFLRLADITFADGHLKIAMFSYACAYERSYEAKVQDYCIKMMFKCSKGTEWGAVFQEHEIALLDSFAPIHNILIAPWSINLREAVISKMDIPTLQLHSRQPLFVLSTSPSGTISSYKLPRWFRWLIPFHLAIMSTPRNEDDINILAASQLGIRHVVTLTEEEPLKESWFHNKSISNTFLPIPNYYPPSIEQMDLIIRLFDDQKHLPLLVHCGGGKGRAGTVAASYLAAFGFHEPRHNQDHPEMTAAEAISALRSLRPGSLETSQQEAFVSTWCSTIWKRQSVYADRPSEPPPCSMQVDGHLDGSHDLLVLVGLPGSGKSWFSRSLAARDSPHWTRISQDDSGSRASCETEIGRRPTKRVALDRCNMAASDRALWLKLASNWCTSPICIWFDYDGALCESRAQMRAGHPTLPPGRRVRSAIEQMGKAFVQPSLGEGFRAIVTIRSFQAAEELLLRLSTPIAIFKFPRTPHLLDLGAATADDIHVDLPTLTSGGGQVVITEKIDGANMGFSLSFDRSTILVQNRSHSVTSSTHEQFKKLGLWVERHEDDLRTILDRDPCFPERYILFGEWMYATHSIPYERLPDLFIAYDLYDRQTRTFASSKMLRDALRRTSIYAVPIIYQGDMASTEELLRMIQRESAYYEGRVEGIYVKVEGDGIIRSRGKIVRSDFIAGNEHWTRGNLRVNGLQT